MVEADGGGDRGRAVSLGYRHLLVEEHGKRQRAEDAPKSRPNSIPH